MKVEIYSDVVCPWCYIGKRRFERALAALPDAAGIEVVYRPFQLAPDAPASPEPLAGWLERRYGARAQAMIGHAAEAGRAEGIDMDYDRALAVNTLEAHRLLRLAEQEYGPAVQRAVAERLFEAHFARGLDVADTAVLTELAVEAGMERGRVSAYLASEEGRDELGAEIGAAQRLGITAVPTFVFDGRYAVQGAQPTSVFLQALETVARESAGASTTDAAGGACSDDACAV